jgi:SAM-dependent methyltransferase
MKAAETYLGKYNVGYGLRYPDGYFIRVVGQILEYQEQMKEMKEVKVLDYGCGNGVHLAFLKSRWPGCQLFGLDISEIAIEQAKASLPEKADQLSVCASVPRIADIFPNSKYDLIMANQVLYYLDDANVKIMMDQFYDLLNPGGKIFVTWMGVENYYYKLSTELPGTNMRQVVLTKRLQETSEINFKDKNSFSALFDKYTKLQLGYYDSVIREDEGSTMHYFYVGKK